MPKFHRHTAIVLLTVAVFLYGWLWVKTYWNREEAMVISLPMIVPAGIDHIGSIQPTTSPANASVPTPPSLGTLPKSYLCHKISKPIELTGRGSDPAWRLASWTDFFVDIEGDKKPRPRFLTRAKMLWSDQYLYVFAELEEPDLWATITKKNEVIFRDNDFEVFIDSDGHGENYYEFEMNALNTIWELTLPKRYSQGGKPILGTNLPGLVSAVHLDGTLNNPGDVDQGWSVEIAFPFDGLKTHRRDGACPPNPGDRWRLNFSRVEWNLDVVDGKYKKHPHQREDNWVWSPQGVIDMHQPEHWGFVDFIDDRQ